MGAPKWCRITAAISATDPALVKSAVVIFCSILQVWPLMSFVAVKDSRREGGGGEVEDPGPGGGGDDLNVQRHPAAQPPGD